MALGVPNTKSYTPPRPVTRLPIIKTNADRKAPRKGIDFCHNHDKHPEFRAEIQDLTKVVKDVEKMQGLRANLMCLSQLEKEPPNSFFSAMWPRLRKQTSKVRLIRIYSSEKSIS